MIIFTSLWHLQFHFPSVKAMRNGIIICSRGVSGGRVQDFPLPEAANEHAAIMGIEDPLRALSR